MNRISDGSSGIIEPAVQSERVNKRPAEAEIFLTEGSSFRGVVYLRPVEELPGGVTPMEDFLYTAEPLIPCRGEMGQLVMIGRATLSAVEIPSGGEIPVNLTRELPLKLVVDGGHHFEGTLHVSAAPNTRISDSLNNAGEWLLLVVAGGHVWLRKSSLVRAEAL